MAKEIISYNLTPNVTDEEYVDYVTHEKDTLLESLPMIKKFEPVNISGAAAGKIPYKFVGIVCLTSLKEFRQKDALSQ